MHALTDVALLHEEPLVDSTEYLVRCASRSSTRKTFVLDTNVLIHDPDSIFHLDSNDVVIPFVAIEELGRLKKGNGEIAMSARQALRNIEGLRAKGCLSTGVRVGREQAKDGAPSSRYASYQYLISRFINEENFCYLNLKGTVRSRLAEQGARLL